MLVLLYAALAMFVAGNVYRIVRVAAMPVHLRWEIFPIPAGHSGKIRVMMEEVLFLRAVRENNRPLWIWSWLLHWGLYLMICGVALTGADVLLRSPGAADVPVLHDLRSVLCWISAAAGVCGTTGLITRRAFTPLLRRFTSRASFLNLVVLFAIFATRLATLAMPSLSIAATAHLCVLALFLAYFPFTHMTHMYLKYFAFHSVRWDDVPLRAAPALERKVSRMLDLPAGWSAPHIRGAARKTWRSVAAEGSADAAERTGN